MTIETLKSQIEENKVTNDLIIFKNADNSFIAKQYTRAISKLVNKPINIIEDLNSIAPDKFSLFDVEDNNDDFLNVFIDDKLEYIPQSFRQISNTIIIVNSIDKSIEKDWEQFIVKVPKLETWQLKDYAYSICEGVKQSELDKLISLCGNNIERLQSELDKVLLFTPTERPFVFDSLLSDGSIEDLTNYSIFNVTNAITHKDIDSLKNIYKEIHSVDINEFGLLTLLHKNFRNIISVQLTNNPTPESTGLEGKQLYAIKKIPRVYTPEQLVNIFTFLGDIDRKVKNGELPTDIMIDYMITKILSM